MDNLVQSSLLSYLVLILIQDSFYWSTSRSLDCDIFIPMLTDSRTMKFSLSKVYWETLYKYLKVFQICICLQYWQYYK